MVGLPLVELVRRYSLDSGLLSHVDLSLFIRWSGNAEPALQDASAVVLRVLMRAHGLGVLFEGALGFDSLEGFLLGHGVVVLMARKSTVAF